MRSLASFLVGIFLVSSLRAEEKFSMATTPGKLPKDIIPRAYFIHLEPDNAANLIRFSAELKKRELPKIDRWVATKIAQGDAHDQSN
jgi:hypothetical protein